MHIFSPPLARPQWPRLFQENLRVGSGVGSPWWAGLLQSEMPAVTHHQQRLLVGPPAVARVPRAVPLFPLSYLYSGGVECDFNEAEVLHPPPCTALP